MIYTNVYFYIYMTEPPGPEQVDCFAKIAKNEGAIYIYHIYIYIYIFIHSFTFIFMYIHIVHIYIYIHL